VDSAGTRDYHVGKPPDRRASEAAVRRGYDLSGLRARQATREDFDRFDLIMAMDRPNQLHLSRLCAPAQARKLKMMMGYSARYSHTEVPVPYYGGADGFELVLDMLEDASSGLLVSLGTRKVGS
jgi:protein-tyrosine phosphatase